MEERQEKVWQVLQNCRGRNKALTSKQISRLTGLNEREVRAIIAELRRLDYPIASAVHAPYGFFIPETREEAQECLGHIYSRIREMGLTVKPLEKSFGRYLPGRQMVLEIFAEKGEGA